MPHYVRLAKFELTEVLPFIGKLHKQKFMAEDRAVPVKMNGSRLLLIKKTQICACCGLQASHFWLEQDGCYSPHFNLYGTGIFGKEIMLTCDHIIPKAKGGERSQDNIQLLCKPCNNAKRDDLITIEELRKRIVSRQKQFHNEDWVCNGLTFGQIYRLHSNRVKIKLWCPCMDKTSFKSWNYGMFKAISLAELFDLKSRHESCPKDASFGNGLAEIRAHCRHLQRPSIRFWVPKIMTNPVPTA